MDSHCSKRYPAGRDRREAINLLSTMEGYNLSQYSPSSTIVQGRNLNASDAGTNNVVIGDLLTRSGPFQMHLKPGDTITFASMDGKTFIAATGRRGLRLAVPQATMWEMC